MSHHHDTSPTTAGKRIARSLWRRAKLIANLCNFFAASILAWETAFVVHYRLGIVLAGYVWPTFTAAVFSLIINRRSFSLIILALYAITCALVGREVWLVKMNVNVGWFKSPTPGQDYLFVLSAILFIVYLLLAVYRFAVKIVEGLNRRRNAR